jgi:DNA repair protein RecO (recombination protein O)
MEQDRSRLRPAYILHRRPYSNSSLLVECFTPEQGRFPAIAKGVRSQTKGDSALLEPFQSLLIRFSGRGEVKTLTAFEASAVSEPLQGRILFCGFYLNELLMHLLGRSDPHERLFQVYSKALQELRHSENPDRVLRWFEIELLNELGYGLQLGQEADTGTPVKPDEHYQYELERGPVLSTANGSTVRGRTLLHLAGREGQELSREGWREARELMRKVISHYLGGKALKSRELFQIASDNTYEQ